MKLILVGAVAAATALAGVGVSGASSTDHDASAHAPSPRTASSLPGADLADVEPAVTTARAAGIRKSSNLDLVARVPFAGRFRAEDAYGTDLTFKGHYAIAGNYRGFTVYNISNPEKPKRVAQVHCPGAQNDVSVYRNLLILSVDSLRNNKTCKNGQATLPTPSSFEGIRIFNIKNPARPRFVKSINTACGSHTHTLAPDRAGRNLYVYVSSYGPSLLTPNCQPPHDRISVVKIPVRRPARAKVASTPKLFPGGGRHDTSGCHDITAYPKKNLAAGACMGDGILLDISHRAHPKVIHRVTDTRNFAFWHSATFNNAGTKVVFTDELGGGAGAECNRQVGMKRGADAVYAIRNKRLRFRSYYKMPRVQSDTENCVAHNGSLIPVKGRDIMVQAWYQGGVSVWEFTNGRKPREIAHFDRGPISRNRLVLGGSWSAYWYNGYIYSSDITRGLEVFKVRAPWATKAAKVKMSVFNAQSQPSFNG